MNFNNQWSQPYRFTPGKDNLSDIDHWGCKGKAGIYVFRDQYDSTTLYVGKAEGTSSDIRSRLRTHLRDMSKGNAGIGDLVRHQQTFTIRWAASKNPLLSESIAIIQLEPLFNKRNEWAGINRASLDQCLAEGERLGLASSRDKALENLTRWIYSQEISQREQHQQNPVTPLWERNCPPNPERKTYRERF